MRADEFDQKQAEATSLLNCMVECGFDSSVLYTYYRSQVSLAALN